MKLNAEELLAELGWLRRLARSLVGPSGSEEDLVQEAWLAAQRVQGGVTRAWLVRTLRNLAASWHRGEGRLRRREQAVASLEPVETEALLDRSELLGLVLKELQSLADPCRTVLLLMYQEGLSTREAAARLSIPVDTIRWQHREGISRLRQRLEGERRDWRMGLLPLCFDPSKNLPLGAAAASGGAGSATLYGGFVMTWKTLAVALAAGSVVLYAIFGDPLEPSAIGNPPLTMEQEAEDSTQALAPDERDDGNREVVPLPRTTTTVAGSGDKVATNPGTKLTVAVRDNRGQKVAGARVWLGTTPDPVAPIWVTDEEGLADIYLPEVQADSPDYEMAALLGRTHYVQALSATHYGNTYAHTRSNGGEAFVRVFPDADLPVLVLDEAGRPVAGVPVAKLRLRPGRLMFVEETLAHTGSDGMANLRHVLDGFKFDKDGTEFQVGPVVLYRNRPDVTVSRYELPTTPVRITLPPTGNLELEVLDGEGGKQGTATSVRMVIDSAPEEQRGATELRELTEKSSLGVVEVAVTEGVANIPFVGLDFAVLAHAPGADPMDSTFGFGESTPSREADRWVQLSPLEATPKFQGVAQSEQGEVLANRVLHAKVALHEGLLFEYTELDLSTDSGGHFELPIPKHLCQRWAQLGNRKLTLWTAEDTRFVRQAAELELPEGLLGGDDDLGAVVFRLEQPWLSGRAVDSQGQPIPLMTPRLVVRTPQGAKSFRTPFGFDPLIDGAEFAFVGDPLVLDARAGEELELWCYSLGHPDTFQIVSVGQTDFTFQFPAGAGLQGRVTTADGDSPRNYYIHFRTGEESEKRNHPRRFWLARNGRFELDGLPLVRGDLELRTSRLDRIVATVPGVLPGSESIEQAERLNSIVLNSPLNEFVLRVVDSDGEAVDGAELQLPQAFRDESVGAGFFAIYLTEPALVGTLRAPGFQALEVELYPGDQAVVMKRGPKVILRPSESTDLSRGATLVVKLVRMEQGFEAGEVQLEHVDGIGFEGFVAEPGEYTVVGQIVRADVTLVELPFSQAPLSRITVREELLGQEFQVPFDREAFEAEIPGE